jgi:hyaluronan synthase
MQPLTSPRSQAPSTFPSSAVGAELSPTTDELIGASDPLEWLLRLAIVAGLLALIASSLLGPLLRSIITEVESSRWATLIERPSMIWAVMGTLLLAFRTRLWFRYRPAPSATMEDAPTLTVIIPAYNEGAMVASAIESVAQARYPRDRLEIVVVDDGSADDTWEHIERAASAHPDLVTKVRFPVNRGKREGLAAGFRRARGEIVVTIDSDCVIDKEALLALAGALRDPRVGAVAGRVGVYNRRAGIIPAMLHVRFILSFDFLRAAQSTYGTVYCCPGALTAYRTQLVRRVLDEWLDQTFLGARCTYGEDRALTNYVFASGYDAVYQRTALVHTVVPETYRQLCRMLIRWDRSFVREEICFARIVWRRPLRARIISCVDSLITDLRYPVAYASLALLGTLVVHDGWALLRVAGAIGAMSLFNMLYFLRAERSWAFLYGVLYAYFWFVALFWIFPYSALTVRSRSWLTR